MAVYSYTVEGIYETDKGSTKDFTNFKFEIKLPRFYEQGAGTHILRRFLPILIRQKKNAPLFSKVKSWIITDSKKVSDDFPLVGKDIAEMNEQEIQELACMYDIYEIPLPFTLSISELREKATLCYMKKVLKVKMDTPKEMQENTFFKRQPDGTLKLDLGNEKVIVSLVSNYIGKKVETKKKTLEDYLKNIGQTFTNGILQVKNQIDDGQPDNNGDADESDGFPSADDLQDA